ncbi:MAG: polysaccharide biosynthesis protein [Anaerolineales bacterium]|nr:polysaccharide biosynthesis protein [Anaerolineales bacterium]
MAFDLAGMFVAIVVAFAVRYEALIDVGAGVRANWILFVIVPLTALPVYYAAGLYKRLWRYAGMTELRLILLASIISSALFYIVNFFVLPALNLPYCVSGSIWLLISLFNLAFLAGTRFFLRLLQERYRPNELAELRALTKTTNRVLLIGAGDAGALIAREMQTKPLLGLRVVGFIDDNPEKHHRSLLGAPIFGDRTAIPEVVARHEIDQIVITMPSASGRDLRDIVRICERAGVHPRTMPALHEVINGSVSLTQLREVRIEDLLRRTPVRTDIAAVEELLRGKRVLVTGGGGSIGSELSRQILRCQPAELVLVGHGENSIFEIQNELRLEIARMTGGQVKIRTVIADIRFAERIANVFREVRPEIVFHAAAHKHVPLMEENPAEAITNNVLGTRNVVDAALAVGVQRFVLISTDKAVNPTSIMGASKRVAELIVHDAGRRSNRPYVAVRFGNVLGSRGSVVLTFKQQIAAGGPVTVTDPEMRRYFMTIPEASQLVLQAAVLGYGGEVFLLDMGEPVKIIDLATDVIELSGLEVGRDIEIVFTGLRPGEKLYEELFVTGEHYERTQHEKIFIAGNASTFVPEHLEDGLAVLEQLAAYNDRVAIVRGLQQLVPEFAPPQRPQSAPEQRAPARISAVGAAAQPNLPA